MKKSFAMAAALAMAFSAVAVNTYAEDETKVYVTISDCNSALVLTQEPVNVTDIDGDGKLTVNDALYIAHENNYEGGAAAGYKTSVGQFGLGLDVLWGKENKQSKPVMMMLPRKISRLRSTKPWSRPEPTRISKREMR